MKKIVTLFLLLCMVCTGAWADALTSGKKYYIKANGTNFYIQLRTNYTEDNAVTAAWLVNKVDATVFTANTSGSGFSFYSESISKYLAGASHPTTNWWNTKYSDNAYTWYISEAETDVYYIKKLSSGTEIYMGGGTSLNSYIYNNQGSSAAGIKWQFEEVVEESTSNFPSAGTYHVTLTGKTTDRKNYLHSNVDNLLNGNLYTWLAESASTNYNYIWKIVVDANKNATIVNAQGTPLILKKESTSTTAVIRSNVTFEPHSGSYYIKIANNSELKASSHNCLNISDNNYANGNVRAVTSWSTTDGQNASDNHWDINEITGNDFYDVVIVDGIAATGANYSSATYVTYDGQKVFNGGFFAVVTGTEISDNELLVNNLPANKQAVVSISDHTINITFEDAPSGPDWSVYENTLNTLKLYTVGDGLGKYSCTLGERNITSGTLDIYKNNYQTHLQSQSESYYDEDLSQMESLIAGMSLNMPQDGTFIRIHGYDDATAKYLLGTESANSKLNVGGRNDGGGKDAVFYYKDGKLLAYTNGQYADVIRNEAETDILSLAEVGSEGVNVTFRAALGGSVGAYNLIAGNGIVWIGPSAIEATGSTDNSNRLGSNWRLQLEEANELPVAIGSTGFATFYTPVAVVVPPSIKAYVCHLEGENLSVYTCKQTTNIEGNDYVVIPAETAVMLKGSSSNMIIRENVEAEAYSNNSFFGDVVTKPFAADYTYYSLQKDSQNASQVGFFIKSSGNFKGFQAFLKTDIMNPVQRFNVSFDDNALVTDITNVLGTENITIPAYDLSGRKVNANGHRGLYIMNGKRIIR